MVLSKRGQVALEYILIFSFILLVTVGIISAIGQRIVMVQKDNNQETRQKIKNHLKTYIELAATADDGFHTTFRMPHHVEGINYSLNISDNSVLVVEFADGKSYEAMLRDAMGNLCYSRWDKQKYLITIRKINGIVEVSSCDNCTVTYQRCNRANETGNCGSLPADVLNQCRNGYCRCLP